MKLMLKVIKSINEQSDYWYYEDSENNSRKSDGIGSLESCNLAIIKVFQLKYGASSIPKIVYDLITFGFPVTVFDSKDIKIVYF